VILPNPHVTSSLLGSKVLCTLFFKKKNPKRFPSFTPVKSSRNDYILCIFIFYFLRGSYETRFPHFFFVIVQQPLVGQGLPHYRGFTIILRHTTLGRTPLDEWTARRRDPLPDNTTVTRERHPYPRRVSYSQSRPARGRRPIAFGHTATGICCLHIDGRTCHLNMASNVTVTAFVTQEWIIMKHYWNGTDRNKSKYSERKLSQCHSVRHKSHMGWPGIEPGTSR